LTMRLEAPAEGGARRSSGPVSAGDRRPAGGNNRNDARPQRESREAAPPSAMALAFAKLKK